MEGQGRVWLPPGPVKAKGPLVFLAGPIQGARDWQAEAIVWLLEKSPTLEVANPRRQVAGDFVYAEQVDWETEQLARAGREGVILFWLAKEAEHNEKRAFAQTSRVEFGEWMVRAQLGEARLVVGVETGFSGARYIRHRLAQTCPDVRVVQDNLEEACDLVVARLRPSAT
jgi:hypothetical protein